jgi:hypothetical protein
MIPLRGQVADKVNRGDQRMFFDNIRQNFDVNCQCFTFCRIGNRSEGKICCPSVDPREQLCYWIGKLVVYHFNIQHTYVPDR